MVCVLSVLQRGQYSEVCAFALTLCKYDLRKVDLFAMSLSSVRIVYLGSVSSVVCIGVFNIVFFFCEVFYDWWCVL